MLPGFASTIPRSTSCFSTPRNRSPTLSPACPSSNSLRNISTPVTTTFLSVPNPTISTSSPTFTFPRSIRPVATVPRPVIENTSSTGIRNGFSTSRFGTGMLASSAASNSSTFPTHALSPALAFSAVPQVALVQEHDNGRHVHLPRQQNVLPRLRHRPVHRRHHENRPVHLGRPRDHVLHVVGVPRAVHVRVVPIRRGVLHVRRRDRQDLRRIAPSL